jgi:hypothetical protein
MNNMTQVIAAAAVTSTPTAKVTYLWPMNLNFIKKK